MEIIYHSLEREYNYVGLSQEDLVEIIITCQQNFEKYIVVVDHYLFESHKGIIVNDVSTSRFKIPNFNKNRYQIIDNLSKLKKIIKSQNIEKFVLQVIENDKIVISMCYGIQKGLKNIVSKFFLNNSNLKQVFGLFSAKTYVLDKKNLKCLGLYKKLDLILKKDGKKPYKKFINLVISSTITYYLIIFLYLELNPIKESSLIFGLIILPLPLYFLYFYAAKILMDLTTNTSISSKTEDLYYKDDLKKTLYFNTSYEPENSELLKNYVSLRLYKEDVEKIIGLIQNYFYEFYLDNYNIHKGDDFAEINKKRTEYMEINLFKNGKECGFLDIFEHSAFLYVENSFDLDTLIIFSKLDEILSMRESKLKRNIANLRYNLNLIVVTIALCTVFILDLVILGGYKHISELFILIIPIFILSFLFIFPRKILTQNIIYLEDSEQDINFITRNKEVIIAGTITASIGASLTAITTIFIKMILG